MIYTSSLEHFIGINIVSDVIETDVYIKTSLRTFIISARDHAKYVHNNRAKFSDMIEFCGISVDSKISEDDAYVFIINAIVRSHVPDNARLNTSPKRYMEKLCEIKLDIPRNAGIKQDLYDISVVYKD